jgi:type IV secretion system protein VirB6
MLLIPATRGLFAGWVRALAAAALTLMLGWLGITLLLSVLEPWLLALAREQLLLKFQPQTGTTTAALVFVFGAGQVALVIGACVTAFGFRIPRANAGVSRRVTPNAAQPAGAAEGVTSRAQRLAFDLQREPASTAPRVRTLELAAATAPSASRTSLESGAGQPARLGDDYRRPATEPRRLRVRR